MDAIKSLQLPSPHIRSVVTAIEDLKLSTQAMYAEQTSPSGEGHTANPSTPLVLYPSSRPNQPVHTARVILLLHTGVASLFVLCTWGSWLLKTPFSDIAANPIIYLHRTHTALKIEFTEFVQACAGYQTGHLSLRHFVTLPSAICFSKSGSRSCCKNDQSCFTTFPLGDFERQSPFTRVIACIT
jgi:hypothetical protein